MTEYNNIDADVSEPRNNSQQQTHSNAFEDILNGRNMEEAIHSTYSTPSSHPISSNLFNSPHSTQTYSSHSSFSSPSTQFSNNYNAPAIFGQHIRASDSYEVHHNHIQRSQNQQKFKYHYNLLVYMRRPPQHHKIAYDAKISAVFITIWCIVNMIGYGVSDIKKSDKERMFNNLILFLFAILMIHKDLILCNGQSCLPILLLFNFTTRMVIEYIINFKLSMNGINIAIILCILLFGCCRFIFGYFNGNDKYEIHWNLMRCHFFYRGFYIRWMSFLIYCWFNALMILQLMDSLCLGRFEEEFILKSDLCKAKRIQFLTCDTMIVIYCILVLSLWNRLKTIDMKYFRLYRTMYLFYDLSVESHAIKELFVFIGVFVLSFVMYETWFYDYVVKKTILPLTVVIILVINFLMR